MSVIDLSWIFFFTDTRSHTHTRAHTHAHGHRSIFFYLPGYNSPRRIVTGLLKVLTRKTYAAAAYNAHTAARVYNNIILYIVRKKKLMRFPATIESLLT